MESEQDPEDLFREAIGRLEVVYVAHVDCLAGDFVDRIKDGFITSRESLDVAIHETLDGDHWLIYTRKAQAVLLCSSNDGAGVSEGVIDTSSFESGIPWSSLAYSAMEADLWEVLRQKAEEAGIRLDEDDLGMEDEGEDE